MLVAGYEDLRRQAMGDGMGDMARLGTALFVHKGMAAWLRAWSDCTPPSETARIHDSCPEGGVPSELQSEVVMILAGMALNRYQEVA